MRRLFSTICDQEARKNRPISSANNNGTSEASERTEDTSASPSPLDSPVDVISEALRSDEKDFVENYKSDPSFIEFIKPTLKGKMGWLGWGSFLLIDLILGIGIYFGYKAFHSPNAHETILWASGVIICNTSIVSLKLWNWIEASRRSTLHEIKRLELQLARASDQV